MSGKTIVGLVGCYNRPSRTFGLVETICDRVSSQSGALVKVYDLADLGTSLSTAMSQCDLDADAQVILQHILSADALVIGVPTYKGSYPGLFKHLIDLIDPDALAGKPTLLCATGGGDRHALMVEHQMRPLFAFFRAATVGTAIYASASQFEGFHVESLVLEERIALGAKELAHWL